MELITFIITKFLLFNLLGGHLPVNSFSNQWEIEVVKFLNFYVTKTKLFYVLLYLWCKCNLMSLILLN